MKLPSTGAIDCDVHIAMPPVKALLPFMSDYWQDQIVTRYIDRSSFALMITRRARRCPGPPTGARNPVGLCRQQS